MEEKMVVIVDESFNLERAVCNHGFFMMAPNCWDPSKKSLLRPLRLNNPNSNSVVYVSITQPPNKCFLVIAFPHHQKLRLSCQHRQAIREQVMRMLRISAKDEMMVEEFHRLHPEAKKVGFARIFRSPTLFEDMVKSVLLCCCTWARSLDMAQALCHLQRKLLSKRKRSSHHSTGLSKFEGILGISFPSAKEIACLDEETLNRHCNLGYRASIILQLARDVKNGTLNLQEDFEVPDVYRQRLTKIKGFGPFTVANIMMCLGFYQEIPVDTETIKHLEEVHGKTKLDKKTLTKVVGEIYDKYAPFQCLAYWMEHVEYYEKRLGNLSELPHSQYSNVTSTYIQNQTHGFQI